MPKIYPTVGRMINIWEATGISDRSQPCAGIIAYVHNENKINVSYVDHYGCQRSLTSVRLCHQGDPKPQGIYAAWMDYQKGQAAKTDQLESQLSNRD